MKVICLPLNFLSKSHFWSFAIRTPLIIRRRNVRRYRVNTITRIYSIRVYYKYDRSVCIWFDKYFVWVQLIIDFNSNWQVPIRSPWDLLLLLSIQLFAVCVHEWVCVRSNVGFRIDIGLNFEHKFFFLLSNEWECASVAIPYAHCVPIFEVCLRYALFEDVPNRWEPLQCWKKRLKIQKERYIFDQQLMLH